MKPSCRHDQAVPRGRQALRSQLELELKLELKPKVKLGTCFAGTTQYSLTKKKTRTSRAAWRWFVGKLGDSLKLAETREVGVAGGFVLVALLYSGRGGSLTWAVDWGAGWLELSWFAESAGVVLVFNSLFDWGGAE